MEGSGACGLNVWTFLSALAVTRLVRFTVAGVLAARYGNGIITWMKSPTFTVIVMALAVLAIVGTLVSGVALYRSTRREKAPRARTV